MAVAGEVVDEQAPHGDVLGEHQGGLVLGRRRCRGSRRAASSLPDRPGSGPGWPRYWAGWLQICLSAVRSFSTRPRRSMPSAGAICVHHLGDHGGVERRLLGGERNDAVGLDLRRQVGGDAGIGLAPPQQEGAHQRGEAFGRLGVPVALDGHGDLAAEAFERARAARAWSSRGRPTGRSAGSPPACRSGRTGPPPGCGAGPGRCATAGSSPPGPRRRRPAPTRRRPAPRRPRRTMP